MAQKNQDGTLTQPNTKIKVRLPMHRPMAWEVKSRNDATVDVITDRFDRVHFTLNIADETVCDELIKVLQDAKLIMKEKRKKGKKVG